MEKKDVKATAEMRKLVQIGGTMYLSLPPGWIKKHGLKAGEYVPVLADSILKVVPMTEIR